MSIRIVTHAYAKTLPQYAVFLRAQLSSLLIESHRNDIKISVCHSPGDERVVKVLTDLIPRFNPGQLTPVPMDCGSLFRRSIGRNVVALSQTEEMVWFTDVDHYFGPQCLDSLQDIWKSKDTDKPVMVWPRLLQVHKNHAMGDDFCKLNEAESGTITIQYDDFEEKINNRAIGGLQIVNGGFARKFGYLNNLAKWRRPAPIDKPFSCFRDDVKFRHYCCGHGKVMPIDLPGLYRLRHTEVTYK